MGEVVAGLGDVWGDRQDRQWADQVGIADRIAVRTVAGSEPPATIGPLLVSNGRPEVRRHLVVVEEGQREIVDEERQVVGDPPRLPLQVERPVEDHPFRVVVPDERDELGHVAPPVEAVPEVGALTHPFDVHRGDLLLHATPEPGITE